MFGSFSRRKQGQFVTVKYKPPNPTVVIKLDSLSVPSRLSGLGSALSVSPDHTYNCRTRCIHLELKT